jgi:hypothetical protein
VPMLVVVELPPPATLTMTNTTTITTTRAMDPNAIVEGEKRPGGRAEMVVFWRGARPLPPAPPDCGLGPLFWPPGGRPLEPGPF